MLRSVASLWTSCLGSDPHGNGTGRTRGCEAVRAVGGQVLAQDEASSVVWGMPGAVVSAGLADKVLPLRMMADEITRRVRCDRG